MATAVLEMDLERPAPLFDLSGRSKALVLVRLRGVPIGKIDVPVVEGRINDRELREQIAERCWELMFLQGVRDAHGLGGASAPLPTASVVICTRERPDDLRRCLEAIAALKSDGHEVLVVDNRPATTATATVVASFPTVRYAREDRKGLDAARNRAFAEASGEVLAFVDDDAVVDRGWLLALLRPFDNPEVQCVTGLTMPLELETPAQEMFERLTGFSRRGFYRRTFHAPPASHLAVGAVGAGANMAIRRSILAEIGPFDPALDAGTRSESGGDHEFFSRILRAGYKIVYEPRALNWHRHRRTWEELRRAMYSYGVGAYASWTRTLLNERDPGVLKLGFNWFCRDQLRDLARHLVKRRSCEAGLVLAQLVGSLHGPFKYIQARREAEA
jgi:GT2 family glycosyltransferase